MTRRPHRHSDGKYHIKCKKFPELFGSRVQVWNGTAYKTPGGLTKPHLTMNKHHRIVSLKKHNSSKKEKRLEKYGYFAKKGKFGYVKRTPRKKGGGDEPETSSAVTQPTEKPVVTQPTEKPVVTPVVTTPPEKPTGTSLGGAKRKNKTVKKRG